MPVIMRRKAIGFALLEVAAAVGVLVFGAVDVSNDSDSSRAERWLASGLFDMKLRAQRPPQTARGFITSDVDLENAGGHCEQMCSFCHGAARGKMAPLAKRLSPRSPQFVIGPSRNSTWKDAYVIKHGIRWTGCPHCQLDPKQMPGARRCTWKGRLGQGSRCRSAVTERREYEAQTLSRPAMFRRGCSTRGGTRELRRNLGVQPGEKQKRGDDGANEDRRDDRAVRHCAGRDQPHIVSGQG